MQALPAALLIFGLFGSAETVNFDSLTTGTTPPYWTATMTHTGKPAHWAVAPDPSAPSRRNVFAQLSSEGGRGRLPLAIYDRVQCRDGDLSTKFKIVRGRENATAGLVWRFQNPDNYYYLHFSADEQNIGFYHMENGHSHVIPVLSGNNRTGVVPHELHAQQWYVVRVQFKGSHVKVWFGNRKLFEAEDTSITNSGKTGLWTRGDTVAYFDDFHIDKKS